jgi:hypothetical protein
VTGVPSTRIRRTSASALSAGISRLAATATMPTTAAVSAPRHAFARDNVLIAFDLHICPME